jgi:MoaA/NifB/PqqE/SkfB family radical SAM enzyme
MNYINPQVKLFRHLDRLDALFRGRIQAPVNVEIDLSNRCSLGCEWCHFAYTHTRGRLAGKQDKPEGAIPGGDLMDLMLAFTIVKDLEDCGVRSITWTGGGEPTLHPDFDRVINFVHIDQGVYTNGTCMDAERAKLLKSKCKWVYVSLDECTQEAYKQHKGVDKFTQVCMNIIELVNAPGSATIGVGFLINKDNWRDAYKMIELGNKLGVAYIQFRPTIMFNPEHPCMVNEDMGWMDAAVQLLESLHGMDKLIIDLDRFRQYRDWNGHGYPICYWSGMQTVITPNGKVWTCVNKREYPNAELGDLSKEMFIDIWKRRKIVNVDEDCRLMCRGHPDNLIMNELPQPNEHGNFI